MPFLWNESALAFFQLLKRCYKCPLKLRSLQIPSLIVMHLNKGVELMNWTYVSLLKTLLSKPTGDVLTILNEKERKMKDKLKGVAFRTFENIRACNR